MIAHNENSAFRHLIWKLDITSLFIQIRFVQQCLIHIHISVSIHIDPFSGTGNHTLNENFVIVIERDNVARLKLRHFHGENNLSVLEGRRYGISVYLKHRKPQGCNQNDNCSNGNQ